MSRSQASQLNWPPFRWRLISLRTSSEAGMDETEGLCILSGLHPLSRGSIGVSYWACKRDRLTTFARGSQTNCRLWGGSNQQTEVCWCHVNCMSGSQSRLNCSDGCNKSGMQSIAFKASAKKLVLDSGSVFYVVDLHLQMLGHILLKVCGPI